MIRKRLTQVGFGCSMAVLMFLAAGIVTIYRWPEPKPGWYDATPLSRITTTPRTQFPPSPDPGSGTTPQVIEVRLGLGQDTGQSLGTLFSIADA